MEKEDQQMLMGFLWPYLVGIMVLSICFTLLILRYVKPVSAIAAATPSVVSFDITKYVNANRAMASKFINPTGNQAGVASDEALSAQETLVDVSKRTKATIEKIAGVGTLVVVKQAVIQGQTRDITDDVLKELGLPVDVPTADPNKLLDSVPTNTRLTAPLLTQKIYIKDSPKAASGVLP